MNEEDWHLVLKQLEPDIENLITSMSEGPKIIPQIIERPNAWELVFVNDSEYFVDCADKLRTIIEWTDVQLHNKQSCKRQGYNSWYFSSKHDIKKFITLYTLKWAT
jgi:hypothetical protein